jgi:23S rRNA (uracil1939-C5)-methyltransferase
MTSLTIEHMGRRGEAVARHDGKPVYVPYALPGETIHADIAGERGTLLEVSLPSPERVSPFCKHFGLCGGCLLQHWEKSAYRGWKHALVEAALKREGLDAKVGPLIDAGGNGRRRASIHARRSGAGFMTLRSHHLHPIDLCPILVPALAPAFDIARAIEAEMGDCDVAVTASETGLDVLVKASRAKDGLALALIAQDFALARLSLNGDVLIERTVPSMTIGKAQVKLPIASFLQATAEGEAALARLVCEALERAKSVADLFCGIGPFALRLAAFARVAGIDNDRGALAALAEAVRRTQGLKPVATQRRDLFREPLTERELASFDAVVFDPPRAGAEAQARELAKSAVKRVVSVSCDAATFARDASILVAGGYRLSIVTPVDQFLWSPHVEIVGVFVR